VDWIGLARDRGTWRALNFQVSLENYRAASKLVTSRVELRSIDLITESPMVVSKLLYNPNIGYKLSFDSRNVVKSM
jgi:hypothetical protein